MIIRFPYSSIDDTMVPPHNEDDDYRKPNECHLTCMKTSSD